MAKQENTGAHGKARKHSSKDNCHRPAFTRWACSLPARFAQIISGESGLPTRVFLLVPRLDAQDRPSDELYLWGLLALTLLQPKPEPELFATPHWCLRQLGVINQTNKRGGRQYKQFAEAIRRLSAVTYMNDGFYDPIREEHRRVSFRFFSYSLPVDIQSSRAWRIAWDPMVLVCKQGTLPTHSLEGTAPRARCREHAWL